MLAAGMLVLSAAMAAWGQMGCGIAGAPAPLCPPVVYHSGPPSRAIAPPPGMARYKSQKTRSDLREVKKDTERLYKLAQQVRATVDKTNENELSLAVVRKAKQIEKLASKIQKLMGHG